MTKGSENIPETQCGEEGMSIASETEPQKGFPKGMFVDLSDPKQHPEQQGLKQENIDLNQETGWP